MKKEMLNALRVFLKFHWSSFVYTSSFNCLTLNFVSYDQLCVESTYSDKINFCIVSSWIPFSPLGHYYLHCFHFDIAISLVNFFSSHLQNVLSFKFPKIGIRIDQKNAATYTYFAIFKVKHKDTWTIFLYS